MLNALARIAAREFTRAWRGGGLWPPVAFFIMVAILFPFGVGPDARLLQRVGGGVAWVAALLAALLPVERLVEPDRAEGVLDQFAVRGIPEEAVALAKTLGHWAGFAPALMAASLPAAAFLQVDPAAMGRLVIALAIGTPALAGLGVAAGALTAGLRGPGAIAGLVVLPLCIPVLIFGAAASGPGNPAAAMKLLAATSLMLLVLSVVAAGAAIRATRS